ncbi:MAG: hypothetical protein Q9161_000069 [Pseudevernia consocians]
MSRPEGNESVSLSGPDFTELPELCIIPRDAKFDDLGAMAHIFIKSFKGDKTAQLLHPLDSTWPEVVDMLNKYLVDDNTHLILAEDETSETIVGWTSVSLVLPDVEDYFKYCDSTLWAGRARLRKEEQARGTAPEHEDDMRRRNLITQLREENRNGQNKHIEGQRLVINTFALHPDVFEDEIPEIAYKLMDETRDLAKREGLPLWAQFPQNSLGDLEALFEEIGFAEVGSFDLDLTGYASEELRRMRYGGNQKWMQWVLREGNWERGRRY